MIQPRMATFFPLFLVSCVASLPDPPGQVREYGLDHKPPTERWRSFPEGLVSAANTCARLLYEDAKSAKKSHRAINGLVIAGGSVSIAGGASAAIIGATIADDSEQAKAAAVTSAIIGAVAGVVTIVSKTVQPVEMSVKAFGARSAHWHSAMEAINSYPAKAREEGSSVYLYAVQEFTACAGKSDSSPGAQPAHEKKALKPIPSKCEGTEPMYCRIKEGETLGDSGRFRSTEYEFLAGNTYDVKAAGCIRSADSTSIKLRLVLCNPNDDGCEPQDFRTATLQMEKGKARPVALENTREFKTTTTQKIVVQSVGGTIELLKGFTICVGKADTCAENRVTCD